MKKEFPLTDRETAYFYLKKDFLSAYKNNGNNIQSAINQVSDLRMVEKEYVRSVLADFIKQLKK